MTPIGLGIVGLGRGFMLTLPALAAHRRIRIAGAFDLRPSAVERIEQEFGARGYDSLEMLLADPGIEAVYVATPHELHAAHTIAALDAGKHVLVEKPMAVTAADGIAMVAAARRAGRVLMVGPSHAYDEPVLHAGRFIASGQYGRVRHVTALNYTDFMFRPRRPEELDEARGGGVVFSQAAHHFDLVRRLAGAKVRSVRAITGSWDPARGGPGAYSALVEFGNRATAAITYSGHAHYDSDELVGWISEAGWPKDPAAYGDARRRVSGLDTQAEAAAKLTRTYGRGAPDAPPPPAPHHEHFGFVLVSCERADLQLRPTGIVVHGDDARHVDPLDPPVVPRSGILDAFLRAIAQDDPAAHDGSEGLDTVACCQALIVSARARADVSPDTLLRHIQEEDTQ